MDSDDVELVRAVTRAASALRAAGPLPARSEDVLRFAVRDQLHASGVHDVDTENSNITGGWSPLPRGLDLFAGRRPHRWAAETKVWDISQQIWDALKLAAGVATGDLRVGYLITAACPSAFATSSGRELFDASTPSLYAVRNLIAANARAWRDDLKGGSGRPVLVPAAIRLETLVDQACWFGHRVRLVRIEIQEQTGTLSFTDGWPEGMKPDSAPAKRARAATTDVAGLAVPARWSDTWWADQRRRGVTPEQFEALYGLLLTRGWSDAEMRAGITPPTQGAPAWWTDYRDA